MLGIAVAFRPFESAKLLLSLLGAALIAQGILNLIVAIITVKIVKNQYPDVIDVLDEPLDGKNE